MRRRDWRPAAIPLCIGLALFPVACAARKPEVVGVEYDTAEASVRERRRRAEARQMDGRGRYGVGGRRQRRSGEHREQQEDRDGARPHGFGEVYAQVRMLLQDRD